LLPDFRLRPRKTVRDGFMTSEARRAFDHALSLERAGDSEAALAAYLDAMDLAPDDLEIAYKTATALLRAGLLEEAMSQLRRIAFNDPQHADARASLGNCQFLQGDLENAERNFRDVLSEAPEHHNALYGLASVLMQTGRDAEALVPARQLAEELPENAAAQTLYAQARARDPQPSASIAAFRKALHKDPEYVPALLGLAEVLVRARRYKEAINLAAEAGKLQRSQPEAFKLLGDAHQGAGDHEAARNAYLKALAHAPNRSDLLLPLSVTSRKLEDNEAALLHARQALISEPENALAANAVGAALAALRHPLDAKAVLTSVARKTPLDVAVAERIDQLCSQIESRDKDSGGLAENDFPQAEPDEETEPG
jgi:tetratricopeptide (TPR) repeat protein